MLEVGQKSDARSCILKSIRDYLAASAPHDAIHREETRSHADACVPERNKASAAKIFEENEQEAALSSVNMFKENLEAVGGHCLLAHGEQEIVQALTRIITGLQSTPLRARRIALSNAATVERLARQMEVETDEIAVAPSAAELFGYDVGLTTAQGAIAETGTLVLESERERHRLVSLLPPVHIAIVEAKSICLTLGEALSTVHRGGAGAAGMSRTITFITGPSRTADIELTLAIGVHGPQELYVIIHDSSATLA